MVLSRRHFLKAAGVSLALPCLEAMGNDPAARPKRAVFFFVPNGVNMWQWHPREVGADYRLGTPLEPLAPYRRETTIFSGLKHFSVGGGHEEAAVWLTGNERYRGNKNTIAPNTISIDQHIARTIGQRTRIPNLVLSSMGGTNTISFNDSGRPVSAEANLRAIFNDLVGTSEGTQRLGQRISILDALGDETRELQRSLGQNDRQRVDEYLESVRAVELRVRRDMRWVQTDRPTVDERAFAFDADPFRSETQGEYVRTMLDLMALALQTDSTRVIAFQSAPSEGVGALKFYSQFGSKNWHGAGHDTGDLPEDQKPREYAFLAQIDRWWVEHLASFLRKLTDAREGDGNVLDHTLVMYGSGMSWPARHIADNLPILLAGGSRLGLRHGRHIRVNENLPMRPTRSTPGAVSVSDLLRTISERLDVPANGFGQSNQTLERLLT